MLGISNLHCFSWFPELRHLKQRCNSLPVHSALGMLLIKIPLLWAGAHSWMRSSTWAPRPKWRRKCWWSRAVIHLFHSLAQIMSIIYDTQRPEIHTCAHTYNLQPCISWRHVRVTGLPCGIHWAAAAPVIIMLYTRKQTGIWKSQQIKSNKPTSSRST